MVMDAAAHRCVGVGGIVCAEYRRCIYKNVVHTKVESHFESKKRRNIKYVRSKTSPSAQHTPLLPQTLNPSRSY